MTRCCFVSAGGDPYLSLLMLKLFKNVWRDEVDKLYICYNGIADEKVVNLVRSRYEQEPKVIFIYDPAPLGFGQPVNRCLEKCQEDVICLLEDDGFIFRKGFLDNYFKMIEGGGCDVVGSPRFSCTPEIAEATKIKYKLDYSGVRDVGPNYWPNFLLLKRKDLLRTDLNFAGKGWKAGDYIKELDWTCREDQAGDTFVWTCIQLRAMGLKIKDVLQCHASPNESDEKKAGTGKWAYPEEFGWIHGGSLSSGWNGFLDGHYSGTPANEYGLMELETRVAFWTIAVNQEPFEEIAEFRDKYKAGIENMIVHYQMSRGRINEKVALYKQLLGV